MRAGDAVHPARLVVAADGRTSTLAAGLGLAAPPRQPRRWAMGAYLTGVTGMRADYGEMHVRDGRYLGIAPMASGLANVCLVVPCTVARTAMRTRPARFAGGPPAIRDRVALSGAALSRLRCSARWPWMCRCRAPPGCCLPATPPASSIR